MVVTKQISLVPLLGSRLINREVLQSIHTNSSTVSQSVFVSYFFLSITGTRGGTYTQLFFGERSLYNKDDKAAGTRVITGWAVSFI